MSGPDEFEWIAHLLRPLATAPEALGLTDDAAVLTLKAGHDLVVTQDALVSGVHFLADDPLDLVARKALRVNLSDLAAKAAEPFGYLMTVAWPGEIDWQGRALFAAGLAEDQARYGVSLLGGDTVSTPGPLTVSITALGWSPSGRMIKRSGAKPGDLVLVSGPIGDGWLGLAAAARAGGDDALVRAYRLPEPRLDVRNQLLAAARAAADVSNGLIADLGHIAVASHVRIEVDLEQMPLSPSTALWLDGQRDRGVGLVQLAVGGDDYQIICTADPAWGKDLDGFTPIGLVQAGSGVGVKLDGRDVAVDRRGWRHGKDG